MARYVGCPNSICTQTYPVWGEGCSLKGLGAWCCNNSQGGGGWNKMGGRRRILQRMTCLHGRHISPRLLTRGQLPQYDPERKYVALLVVALAPQYLWGTPAQARVYHSRPGSISCATISKIGELGRRRSREYTIAHATSSWRVSLLGGLIGLTP